MVTAGAMLASMLTTVQDRNSGPRPTAVAYATAGIACVIRRFVNGCYLGHGYVMRVSTIPFQGEALCTRYSFA